jgi:hypothetical protein
MSQPPTMNYNSPTNYSMAPRTNGLALAALILGIAAYPVSCIPYLNFICWIAAVLAVVFGILARKQIAMGNGTGHGMAAAGMILGIVYLALFLIAVILVLTLGFTFFHLARSAAQQQQQRQHQGGSTSVPSEFFRYSAELAYRSARAWLASR